MHVSICLLSIVILDMIRSIIIIMNSDASSMRVIIIFALVFSI